jgi:integrase
LRGQVIRKALDTRNWDTAQAIIRAWESGESIKSAITVRDAAQRFTKDAQGRNLHWTTFKKYKLVLRQLEEFSELRGLRLLKELDLPALRDFLPTLKDGPLAKLKKIERLRSFFRFCKESGWIQSNPAKLLKPPIVRENPTLPFSRDEMKRMLEKAEGDLLTFVLLLRYSGMRISDAAMLKEESLHGNRLLLYTAKTGTPVFVPLPPELVEKLRATTTKAGYFFITESTRMETVTNTWRRKLAKLFKDSKISGGHPHRLRDTAAVEWLLAGIPIESVAVLLGHSIKICEKHYAPWVKARQEQLEDLVKRSWGN